MPERYRFDTRVIHAGEAPDPATGAHGVPLYQNVTYAFRSFDQVTAFEAGQVPHYVYARYGNPTVRCFELKMADLEGAETAVAAATGMAAISATLLHLTEGGGHAVVASDLYAVTRDFLATDLAAQGASATAVRIDDAAAAAAAMRPETRLIFCEVYSNPALHVADVPALAEIAHRRGALLVVDNTFLSPAIVRPLAHAADLTIHSATKYLAGTGQVMGGVVAGRCELINPIAARLARQGATMTPFAAWLLLSGIRTLPLRMERHSATAQRLAELLAAHPAVEVVNFPGLPSHPNHEAAMRLSGGRHGGLLSVRFHGEASAARAFVDALELCTIAVSLGEATTLVWPLRDGMIRLAVGLEDPADLESDIRRGLEAAARIA